jgi:alpha-ketoglutarate-dependent 2,4-dichlorophenoxyacetate dioxygenase
MFINTKPLHPTFGVIIEDIDLNQVSKNFLYKEIRELFENYSAILFKKQEISNDAHISFAKLFGDLENREAMANNSDVEFELSLVTNQKKDKSVYDEFDIKTLDLKANMLWHTDSTFLPVPALANIITAKIIPSSGGETELASTRVALKKLPKDLYHYIKDKKIWHNLSHSRKQINEQLAEETYISRWPSQKWDAILKNPETGEKSIYIASHSYQIEGMSELNSQKIITEVINFCTQNEFVYSHSWSLGDVLIWDERSILHRGRPWPYEEPRTMSSICVSVGKNDGFKI